ncbi:hypothetical protein LR48_Vigan06g100100 [Vigna angularis]|uniref:Uncharacterized protein n=1 Tax=Phaseolus angularis TaxID=3914 RepID=A0A0L9US45_PHAAN|nr:hypothetical protein LR48_Vigan06g100100 [Vigna angularis]
MISVFIRVIGVEVSTNRRRCSGSKRRIAAVAILVHAVGVAGIDETPLTCKKWGRRFRAAAFSVGGIVGDALGRQKKGATPRVGEKMAAQLKNPISK